MLRCSRKTYSLQKLYDLPIKCGWATHANKRCVVLRMRISDCYDLVPGYAPTITVPAVFSIRQNVLDMQARLLLSYCVQVRSTPDVLFRLVKVM